MDKWLEEGMSRTDEGWGAKGMAATGALMTPSPHLSLWARGSNARPINCPASRHLWARAMMAFTSPGCISIKQKKISCEIDCPHTTCLPTPSSQPFSNSVICSSGLCSESLQRFGFLSLSAWCNSCIMSDWCTIGIVCRMLGKLQSNSLQPFWQHITEREVQLQLWPAVHKHPRIHTQT